MKSASYPFNNHNLGPAVVGEPEYPNLITPSYFGDTGVIEKNSNGVPKKTAVGPATHWPIGLMPASAFDLCMNVKAMRYKIHVLFELVNDFGNLDFETLEAQGIIRRFLVSHGSIFKYKFQSINKGNVSNKTTTDAVIIDFTKAFFDLRSITGQRTDYYWFPQVMVHVAGRNGYIANGVSANKLYFSDFKEIIPGVGLDAYSSIPGIPLTSMFLEEEVQMTERYDEIFFAPQKGAVGTEVTITCPATKEQYDSPGYRDGFEDVTEVSFEGAAPVTTFQKIQNTNTKVWDQIKVTVPSGARSGVIKFKSVANKQRPDTTSDLYSTASEFFVT